MDHEEGYDNPELRYDLEKDFRDDYDDGVPVEGNVSFLTRAKIFDTFMNKYPCLQDLKPLADQIMATNYYTVAQAESARLEIDNFLDEMEMNGDFCTLNQRKARNIVQIYLHRVIDGNIGGHRAKLITEKPRRYITEVGSPEQRRRGLLRR